MNIKNIADNIVFSEGSLTKRVLYADGQVLNFVLNLRAGQSLPQHRHEQSAVIVFVLSGICKISVDGDEQDIRDGAVVLVENGKEFGIPEVAQDISLYITISPNPHNDQYSRQFG